MANLESIWHGYLKNILDNGHITTKDDGDKIKEIIGVHKTIYRPQDLFPLAVSDIELFLNYMKKGWYDISGYSLKGEALYEYVTAWNKPDMIYPGEDGFVYTYPERIFNFLTCDKVSGEVASIDQFEVMIERLYDHKGSNRAVATLYNAGLDRNEQHIPCLNFLQAIVRDEELTLSCMFRSNDIFNAWPSNMYLLTYLGMLIGKEIGVELTKIDYHCSSAHYYLSEESLVKKVLR